MKTRPFRCRRSLLRAAASLALAAAALSAADLEIVGLTLRAYEGGPPWISGYTPMAGDHVAFDFRIDGFASVPGDFEDAVKLQFRAELVDSTGRLYAAPVSGKTEPAVTEEDKKKDWKPKMGEMIQLPSLIRAQPATLRITVEDLVGKTKATMERAFEIEGKRLDPAAPLSAIDFRFLRTEDDGDALAVAAYRQGDAVWGRFEIVGFRPTTEGSVDVSYGLEVADASGKVLYSQTLAAEEQKEFFYPPSYLPGVVSLQLQPNTPKGEYGITLTVRDRIAKSEAVSRYTFSIE